MNTNYKEIKKVSLIIVLGLYRLTLLFPVCFIGLILLLGADDDDLALCFVRRTLLLKD